MESLADRGQDPTLADKVAALGRRDFYREGTAAVACMETHMSWVFLTDRHAYKLKKPVRYEYLDFSTPALRRLNCDEEIRLNRRLAAEIYLGVVPLTLSAGGRLELGGAGPAIDWLVKMRRLPEAGMLDAAIAAGTLQADDIARIADLLAGFYTAAPPVAITASMYCGRFEGEIALNRSELPRYGLSPDEIEAPLRCQAAFIQRHRDVLEQRARERRIVEGHGDLRPEHVYVGPPATVIDCLEFNYALRLVDPVDEIGYLAMECERLGAPAVGEQVLAAYETRAGDRPPAALLHFYMSLRACVRARLAIWHLRDEVVTDRAKWIDRARDYLRHALRHAEAVA
jgi:aminoglycoside phosphotransferase family enzyme